MRYQHHGRLAFDGTNHAAYFADAITVTHSRRGAGKVDIHDGDRLKEIGPTGALLSEHDSGDLVKTGSAEPWEGSLDVRRRLRWAQPSSVNAQKLTPGSVQARRAVFSAVRIMRVAGDWFSV